jgi:ParB family chromosome partitioning protein
MSSKRRGLGKGLNELLSATLAAPVKHQPDQQTADGQRKPSDSQLEVNHLPVDKLTVSPFQPRQHIRHEGLEELSESISKQGLIQPIVVRAKKDGYEIIAGERRWRAAQLAGFTTIPAIVRQVPDEAAMAMALIENIQRENLSVIEEAVALKRLSDELKLTHLQVAEAVGKSRTSVTNLLRLLSLNPDVQSLLESQKIEMGHARALLGLKGTEQSEVAQLVVQNDLSVRETERLVNDWQAGVPAKAEKEVREGFVIDPNIRRLENDLGDKLGARVKIKHTHHGKGLVMIRYNSVDELEGILAHVH